MIGKKLLNDPYSMISGTIVDYKQIEITESLLEQTLQGLSNIKLRIIGTDTNSKFIHKYKSLNLI